MRNPLLLILSLLWLISCTTQEVCNEVIQSDAVVRFKKFNSNPVADTIISGVSVFGIREGQTDSLLYDSSTTSLIILPLDPHYEFSRYVFSVNDISDTLHIIHTTETYLISYYCGFASIFTLANVSYTHGMIQDHEIINSIVDAELEQNEEHLWLYF